MTQVRTTATKATASKKSAVQTLVKVAAPTREEMLQAHPLHTRNARLTREDYIALGILSR
jgi:hypothetical protein